MLQKFAIPVWIAIFAIQAPMLAGYFRQLVKYPGYAWLPLAAVTIFVLGLLAKWDFRARVPTSGPAAWLVVAGLLLSLAAAVADFRWFAVAGLALTLGGFLASHGDRGRDASLVFLWPLVFSVVRPPLGGYEWLQVQGAGWIADLCCNVMRLLEIPHVQQHAAISLPGLRLYPDLMLSGIAGWPLFSALAMLHSSVFRRSWAIVVFNWFSGWAACFVFHCGVILSIAFLKSRNADYGENWLAVYSVWGFVVWGLFASAERAMRGATALIADGSEDARQANPLVMVWNRLFGWQMPKAQDSAGPAGHSAKLVAGAVVGLVLLAGIAQAARVPAALARATEADATVNWQPAADALAPVWSHEDLTDYQYVTSLVRPEWGMQAQVWTQYLPSRTSELVVTHRPQRWRELPAIYLAQGWLEVAPVSTVGDSAGNPAFSTAVFSRDEQFVVLFFSGINVEGQPVPARPEDPRCVMVHSASVLEQEPSDATRQVLAAEYAKLFKVLLRDFASR